MKQRVTIRRARRADAPAFLRLLVALAEFEKLQPPSPAARWRIVRDIFERKLINLLLAVREGKPIGYALHFFTYSSFLARPTLYLEDLFVLSEFRGSGVGKSLFMRCVGEASKKGCGRMEWSVLTWNKKAMRFYEDLGARELSEWRVYRLDSRGLGRLARAGDDMNGGAAHRRKT
jgi:GNAT superfamily N-acetyltransferase